MRVIHIFLLTGSFGRLATDGGSRANGEIVVYQILEESDDDRKTKKKFRICSRISNKPSDSVGCWFGNKYVISSDFKWLAHLVSSSKLWMNKVQSGFFSPKFRSMAFCNPKREISPQVDVSLECANDYTLACMRALYNFYNSHGNAVRFMLVAELHKEEGEKAPNLGNLEFST